MKHLGQYVQSQAWEKTYLERERSFSRRRKRLKLFNIKKDDLVLDLGCGSGSNIAILHQMGIKNITGVDISPKLLKAAKRKNPHIRFYLAEADKLVFKDKTFTVVLVDSVFHHLLHYQKALREIKRILKQGGYLCLIEPHGSLIRSLLDLICELPLGEYLPVVKKRRPGYLEERNLMKHWLKTEQQFYKMLLKVGFRKIFFKVDALSIVAKYQQCL